MMSLLVPLVAGCIDEEARGSPPDVADPGPLLPSRPVFGPNVTVSSDRAHRETSLAISPLNDAVMFLCDPSGLGNTADKQSYFFRSLDNGTTWQYVTVKTEPTDSRSAVFEGGDCDVAFDAVGTMYTADSWGASISVGASRDQGATWTSGTAVGGSGPVADRPWLVGGPAGTLHMTYQDLQFGMPSVIWYTRSTDYAATFLPAVPVTSSTEEGAFTWTGNLVASPDGQDLFSVYTRRARPVVGTNLEGSGPEQVFVANSHDAGLRWTSVLVSARPNPASFLYPSIGMDAAGGLHVVFAQRTDDDHPVWYSFSSDEGQTWTEPVKALAGVAAYSPWIVGGKAGQAAIQWLGSPDGQAPLTEEAPWFIYWARVTGAGTGNQTLVSGTTSMKPLYRGIQAETPEFNQVKLDNHGRMRFGASIRQAPPEEGTVGPWSIQYQAQVDGPTT